MNSILIISLVLSHLLAIAISAKWTSKLIYTDIKTNYDVIEFVRVIEEAQSRRNHPTARPQFYDWETEEKFENIIDQFDK
jgi:uncharacterized membrane protein